MGAAPSAGAAARAAVPTDTRASTEALRAAQ